MTSTISEKPKSLTKQGLKERGWSESMIKTLLGEPDERKKVSGFTHPLCLYKLERVIKAEQTDDFRNLLKKKERQLKIAQKNSSNKNKQT